MSYVKLEVGQIWLSQNSARKITYIGKENVIYMLLTDREQEHSANIDHFIIAYAKELITCWPLEPELKELTAGFRAVISVDKDGNIVISKGTLESIIAGYKACMGVKDEA